MDNLKPPVDEISYISTGLSDSDRDYPNLQDMQWMVEMKPEMTAAELLAEVARQIQEDKAKRAVKRAEADKNKDPYERWNKPPKKS